MASPSMISSLVIGLHERHSGYPSTVNIHQRSEEDKECQAEIAQLPSPVVAVGPTHVDDIATDPMADPEFKLPKRRSLAIILVANLLLQMTFFIPVSSSSAFAAHLGGTATFSGLVIGIPTAIGGLILPFVRRYDQGVYKRPLHIACFFAVLGQIAYSLAYRANFLYLILIGRMLSGGSFIFFMYAKQYCTDPRIVGVRRRTLLAGWLTLTQGCGLTLGPFLGGILYKIGFSNEIFNGFTAPTWLMGVLWLAFWAVAALFYVDVPIDAPSSFELSTLPSTNPPSPTTESAPTTTLSEPHPGAPHLTWRQWGVCACMCWYSMTSFFILGGWEANIPVFASSAVSTLAWSPLQAGNFIALGGISTFPFLFANMYFSRRIQDRITLTLGTVFTAAGLFTALGLLVRSTFEVGYGSYFACWFFIALGTNLATTVTVSLLSKQLPGSWNASSSMAIQYSNYTGRVTGATWGGSGVHVGMVNYVGMQIGILGVGAVMLITLYRELKAKAG